MNSTNGACDLQSEQDKVNYIVEQLESTPSWINVTHKGGDKEMREDITRINLGIARFGTKTIRKAVKQYMNSLNSDDYFVGSAKVFVLLRVIFNVPKSVNVKEARYFGGWANPSDYPDPRKTDTRDLLWPYKKDKEGHLVLYGTLATYTGPAYAAMQEFDFFEKHFGRRPLESQHGKDSIGPC